MSRLGSGFIEHLGPRTTEEAAAYAAKQAPLRASEVAAGRPIAAKEALVQRFAASTSMEEVPGSPAFHEALAAAAISMGLPVPRWYLGESQTLVADAR